MKQWNERARSQLDWSELVLVRRVFFSFSFFLMLLRSYRINSLRDISPGFTVRLSFPLCLSLCVSGTKVKTKLKQSQLYIYYNGMNLFFLLSPKLLFLNQSNYIKYGIIVMLLCRNKLKPCHLLSSMWLQYYNYIII